MKHKLKRIQFQIGLLKKNKSKEENFIHNFSHDDRDYPSIPLRNIIHTHRARSVYPRFAKQRTMRGVLQVCDPFHTYPQMRSLIVSLQLHYPLLLFIPTEYMPVHPAAGVM